ncbi:MULTISPECIES: TonB-dependent receptor plug domain-containing protein [Pseudoalteromonas]|uniref:TonB-dependent receptor plug domain-containing protein n=1 Tax=Pseudoalteromonas TaxID=53246 RepID=UPI0002F7D12A|nr:MULTISPECIES: TonB-dependent receptor [Pseudoalteromonas]MCF6142648.1 iron complex outermembrane recepter protein [Pseudoalteromonas mariniglutinosa NCIMB 1770]
MFYQTKLMMCATIMSFFFVASVNAQIEQLQVYGNFYPVKANQMPSSLFVLEKSQIDTIAGLSALDVLTLVPGVRVQKSGVSQEIFLRGAETNFVIVQIDGVQVNNPLDSRGGSFDLGTLSKDSIQRVEVIKGAQSSIYGSDAIAGVINFITYDADTNNTLVSAGAFDNGSQTAMVKLAFDSTAIGVTAINSDNSATGDEQESIELNAHTVITYNNDSETKISVRLSDYQQKALADQSGGILYAQDSTKDDKQGQIYSGSVRHNQQITQYHQLALQAEVFNSSDSLKSPGITPYFSAPPTYSENDYSYYKLRFLNGLQFNHALVTVGIDFKSESGETNGSTQMHTFTGMGEMVVFDLPTEYDIDRENLAGFVDAKWHLDKVTVFSGIRYDNTKDFGDQTTWKLGANYEFNEQVRVFANTGTAFKLPSLYALSNNLIGNPNLTPEEATNHDIGIEFILEKANVSLSVFNYEYTDLVDFDFATFSLVNRSKIISSGIELIVQGQLNDDFSYDFDLTYIDLESSENEILTGRPDWQGGLGIQYQVSDSVTTSLNFDYVGETIGTSQYTGENSVYDLNAYNKIDVTAQWKIRSHIRLDVYLQNIFDKSYQVAVGVPGQDLGFGANVQWTFDKS